MRPKSIVWFERVYVAAVAMGYAALFREWRALLEAGELAGFAILLAILLFMPVILALLVTRRPSRAALLSFLSIAWLFGAVWLIGVAGVFPAYLVVELHSTADLAAFAFQLVAAAATLLLFTPSARAWLAAPLSEPRSAETFARTFE